MLAAVVEAKGLETVQQAVASGKKVILNFWASWCEPAKQMNAVFAELASTHPDISFVQIDAEELGQVAEHYNVETVPFFLFFMGGTVWDRLEGADPAALAKKTKQHSERAAAAANPTPATTASSAELLNARLEKLVNYAPVMLFMKGTPDAPQCGFSRKIVGLLNEEQVQFSSFNILGDNTVREGLKTFSNWPTYPQLYVKGKLVGGLDIVQELKESGELKDMIPSEALNASSTTTLNERLEKLVNKEPVMLFMKGTPEEPRCGFSRKMVSIIDEAKVKYGSFDILSDNEVREGLKAYSNWPTYPQLYVQGKLIGGLDIVTELKENDELNDIFPK
ncbi:Glutaredoxin 3 [Balamuthia mandrillaris]